MCPVRGAGPGCNSQEIGEKLSHLKREISQLDDHEQMLDLHKQWIQQSITNITDDIDNNRYLYVSDNDVCTAFSDLRSISVKLPVGTNVAVLSPVILQILQRAM